MAGRRRLEWSDGAAGPVLRAVDDVIVPLEGGSFGIAAGVTSRENWSSRALCAQVGGDFWFPEKGGSTREAKKICRGCEVRVECLEYALEHHEAFGIWGGLSERERHRMNREAA